MNGIFYLFSCLPILNKAFCASPFSPSIDPLPGGAYTSYAKGPVCTPSGGIRTAHNLNDIVNIVREAISRKLTVKALGHIHSVTDIICTDGIPIDMRGVRGIKLNKDLTVTVGAGVFLHDLTTFLKQRGRSLKTTPAFGNITVGGALGTGAHGSTLKYNASISDQVTGLTIVDGFGDVQKIYKEEDLRAFRIHLGLLGVIVDVTLNTEPLYKVRTHNYLVDDEILTNGKIIEIARNTDQITAYWFPSFKKVWNSLDSQLDNCRRVDVKTPGEAKTNDHVPPTSATFNSYFIPTLEILQSINSFEGLNLIQSYTMQTMLKTIPDFVPIYTKNGITVENPAVGYYDVMFAPICDDSGFFQCAWLHGPNNASTLDNEISIDLEKLPHFARTVKDIGSKTPIIVPLQGMLLRFSRHSNTYMSTSFEKDTCHVEFYTAKRKNPYEDASTGLAAYQTIMQSLAKTYNGRSHWGKSGMYYHSREMLISKLNPTARASFISKMNQFDPNGIFLNDFGKRLKGIGNKIDIDPATTHCALLDNCICSRNSDCAEGQECSQISGYHNFPVCVYPDQQYVKLDSNAYKFNTSRPLQESLCSLGLELLWKEMLRCT